MVDAQLPAWATLLRPGSYTRFDLSTGQRLVLAQDVEFPTHFQKVIARKRKYAQTISTKRLVIPVSSNGSCDAYVSKPDGVVYVDLAASVVMKRLRTTSEESAYDYVLKRSHLSRMYSLPRLLDLSTDSAGYEYCIVESAVFGDWFGELSFGRRAAIASEVLERSLTGDFFETGGFLSSFGSWVSSLESAFQLDSPHHGRIRSLIEQGMSRLSLRRSFDAMVVQNRDLCAHNFTVKHGSMVVVDTSPNKVGLAPAWYDFIVLIASEASEYDRNDLLGAFLDGFFDDYLSEYIDPGQPEQKMWMLSLATALMAYLPFKIKAERISSWLEPAFKHLDAS